VTYFPGGNIAIASLFGVLELSEARLPLPMLQALTRETGQQLSARTPAAWAFRPRGSRRCAAPLRRSKRTPNSTRTVRGCILTWCWPR